MRSFCFCLGVRSSGAFPEPAWRSRLAPPLTGWICPCGFIPTVAPCQSHKESGVLRTRIKKGSRPGVALLLCGAVLVVPLLLIQNGADAAASPRAATGGDHHGPTRASDPRPRSKAASGAREPSSRGPSPDRSRPAAPPTPTTTVGTPDRGRAGRDHRPHPGDRRPPGAGQDPADHHPPDHLHHHPDRPPRPRRRRWQTRSGDRRRPGHVLRPPGRHLRQPVAVVRYRGPGDQPGQRCLGDLHRQ